MENISKNVMYPEAEKELQRTLSAVKKQRAKDESLPDFDFLRTNFAFSQGIKTWVSLKAK